MGSGALVHGPDNREPSVVIELVGGHPLRLLTRARIQTSIIETGGHMERTVITTTKGVAGISRPFKSIIEQLGLHNEDTIMYVGLPGVCTPFVELLSYAIRTLGNQTGVCR